MKMTRAAFGGNFLVTVANSRTKPQMATVRPKVFAAAERDASKSCDVVAESVATSEDDLRTKVLQFMRSETAVNLIEADIIVSGGRGVGKPEGFKILQRPRQYPRRRPGCVSRCRRLGLDPQDHQVGQTGKTVKPKIYIACAISGAIQHLAGMRDLRLHRRHQQGCRSPYL